MLPVAAIIGAFLLLGSGIHYTVRHSLPVGWDEPMYLNQVRFDRDTLLAQGPLVFARKQIGTEPWRPPAYRLVAAPVALLAEPTAPTLRLLSLASLLLASVLLLLAGREVAGSAAGILWAAGFGMAVGPFEADLLFGTEVTLYPALAGTMLALCRWYRRGAADRTTGALLAGSAAVGALSKLSFLVVFLPALTAALALAPATTERLRHQIRVAGAAGIGLLLVSPWWIFNWQEAVLYGKSASDFIRDAEPWMSAALLKLLGVPFTVGILAAAGLGLASLPTLRSASDRPARHLLGVLLIGALPLLVLHMIGENHRMRLVTPALAPAAGIVPLVLHLSNRLARPAVQAGAAGVIVLQCLLLSFQTWRQNEKQTDWSSLRELTHQRGITNPTVMQLGLGMAFNPPQIMYAYRQQGETIRARWLWRWEHGPINWQQVYRRIDDSADVVVTRADTGRGGPQSDNRHNHTLARQLIAGGRWMVDTLPFTESGGPSILVFFRRPEG